MVTSSQILRLGIALLVIGCIGKTNENFIERWDAATRSAIDSCNIRLTKVYYLKDLGFIKRHGIRSRIINSLGDDWKELTAVESFGDERRDYYAEILLDGTKYYVAQFTVDSLFSISVFSDSTAEYERGIQLFEDFPPYRIKCDSMANSSFYFKGRRDD